MNRLDHLYEQMILEHNKNPRGFYTCDPHTHYCHGHNPLCGDDFKVSLNVVDNKIEDIGFIGSGCAISKSSGSMMIESLKGLSVNEALRKKDAFLNLITKDDIPVDSSLGKLKFSRGLNDFR